jgi:hypothetical protein
MNPHWLNNEEIPQMIKIERSRRDMIVQFIGFEFIRRG